MLKKLTKKYRKYHNNCLNNLKISKISYQNFDFMIKYFKTFLNLSKLAFALVNVLQKASIIAKYFSIFC